MKKIIIIFVSLFIMCQSAIYADDFVKEQGRRIEEDMTLNDNYEKGVKKLEALLRSYPDDTKIITILGIAYYGLMEYKKAYTYFEEAREKGAPSEVKNILNYAKSAVERNRNTLLDIEKLNESLKAKSSDEKEIKETMAVKHFRALMNLLEAKYYYASVVTTHIIWIKTSFSDFPTIFELSGDVYYSSMYYRKAEEEYKIAIEKDPENARLRYAMADCLVAIGDFDKASEYYDKSIELYKKEGEKENKKIIKRLKRIKEALPKKYKDIDELFKSRRYEEAITLCKKRLSLNPLDYVALTQLGEVYWKEGKRPQAIKLFKRVIKLVPDYPIAHFMLGRAYVFGNKYKKATKEFSVFKKKMLLIPKMDDDTKEFYISTLHYIAYLYFSQKDYERAFKECNEIVKLDPEDENAHYNLAVCYYYYYRKRGAAYRELKKVMEISPNTHIASRAEFYIDYMRRNPDPRFIGDFTFIYEKDYE